MKKLIIIVFTCLLLLIPNIALAEDASLLDDSAMIINDEDEISIEKQLQDVSNKYGITFSVVTTNNMNNKSDREFADDYYDEHYSNKNGVLVLIDMVNHNWYVSTIGKCVDNISDYEIDRIYNEYVGDHLSNGNFTKGIEGFINGFDKYYQYDDSQDIENMNRSGFTIKNIYISMAFSAVITLITIIVLKSQLKSVKKQNFASNYVDSNSFVLTGFSDFYMGSHISKTPIIKNRSNGNSGGNFGSGHSTHISSSGASHGGHGGHF